MRIDPDIWMACKSREKRMRSKDGKNLPASRKMQKREAVRSVLLADNFTIVEAKEIIVVEDEQEAINLTTGEDYPRANRRLTDFCFHDIDGKAQPVEMLEVDNIFISGLIMPLEETCNQKKEVGALCKRFGRVESWAISGFDDGLLVIWVSTKIADYHCVKPAPIYKHMYGPLVCKAQASIEVYKKLTGGNSDLSLEELLNGIVPLISCSDYCPPGVSTRELIISCGRFIYDQLIGLDDTSCKDDEVLGERQVLVALRDESGRNENCLPTKKFLTDRQQNVMLESKEQAAISLTAGAEDYLRPNRRLTDFNFHDSDGKTQPMEMLQVDNIFVSGLILPLEETPDVIEARCEDFGRVESWAISGYEDGSPVIWVSTKIADYNCLKPANNYKPIYDLLLGKAHACLDIYKRLSRSTGGNPDLNLDVLLSGVVSSVGEVISFPAGVSVRDLIISWGTFLYNELIGLDATSSKDDVIFRDLPVLAALRDKSKTTANWLPSTSLAICSGQKTTQSTDSEIEKDNSNASAEVDARRSEVDSICLTDKVGMVNCTRPQVVEDELTAIDYTGGEDYQRPNRRLTDFIFHDVDGKPQPVEMLEVVNMYISGLILPLEETFAVKCEEFGRIESWAISGYEDGLPVIWVSTKIADYECLEPATNFKMMYNLLLGKAHACVNIYKMLSKSNAGNRNMKLDDLVGGAVCSLRGISRDLIISWGRFIHNELIGLDATSSDGDVIFSELPVLASLRDESDRNVDCFSTKGISSTELAFPNFRTVNRERITKASTSKFLQGFNIATKWKLKRMRSKIMNAPYTVGSIMVNTRDVQVVEDEPIALCLTEGQDYQRPNRQLTDFIFHDASGKPQPIEMLEVENLYVSGLILPLERPCHEEKVKGVRCKEFGRVESWAISGYEDGIPIIWVSTKVADYECVKPSANYQSVYGLFLGKAYACVEIYKRLSGGNNDMSLDELVGGVVRSLIGIMNVPRESLSDLIFAWGRFIFDELIGLDGTSSKDDMLFSESPVLVALKDASEGVTDCYAGMVMSATLLDDEGKQVKRNLLLKEKERWRSLIQAKRGRPISLSYKIYMKINKDDITNEYPVPEYHIKTIHEIDERTIYIGAETCDPGFLPRKMLHNWSLYTSELILVSLEILPMKTYEEINVLAYGSGCVIALDGSRFGGSSESRSCTPGGQSLEGTTIFLGAIKEWKIEVESSSVFISIRTDMGWYRLGDPSKQYASWYEPVLKTAKLAVEIMKLLKMQSRVSRTSFQDVIKIISRINKDNPAYISSNPFVLRRYMIIHGLVILQHIAEYPDDRIKKCAFLTSLCDELEKRCHTKWLIEENINLKEERMFIRRASKTRAIIKRKLMPATMTRMIDRIWGEYYSNYSPQDLLKENGQECVKVKRQREHEAGQIEKNLSLKGCNKPCLASGCGKRLSSNTRVVWLGDVVGKTCEGDSLYKRAIVRGNVVSVGGSVLVEAHGSEEYPPICFVEYMFENSDARKLIHGRLMLRGCQTVVGNTANEREVFLTNDCVEFELGDVQQTVFIETICLPWGYQHRDSNAKRAKIDRKRAEDRKNRGLSIEYFCKSLYCPDRGSFFGLQTELMGLGNGVCGSCKMMELKSETDAFKLDMSKKSFTFHGTEYQVNDYIYVGPHHFFKDKMDKKAVKSAENVGLKAYVVCQLLEIKVTHASKQADLECVKVRVRRFFRPEDISAEKAYNSDIREVYYSKREAKVPIVALKGKCEVRREQDLSSSDSICNFEHTFFCKHMYDPKNGALSELPVGINLSHSKERTVLDCAKGKGKSLEGKNDTDCLATLDIFAGCGGLSEGLEQSGVSNTKWAIEYEEHAAEAFQLNHLEAFTCINNCNVILRAIMTAGGDADDCVSVSEDAEFAAKLSENELSKLPQPGQVDFIVGGPPCQGFSAMNRYNQSKWSKVQCEMIPAFLSFVEYFRPKFVLLENVRNFVSFNKGQVFRLTLASLLEMGYQVRFGILEAGAFGISQSRKRAFIWAVSPLEKLPEWPEPMYVFSGPQLTVTLDTRVKYGAVRSTASGAPFRAITVRDAIGDLPTVGNGASLTAMEYKSSPVSWFQKRIRRHMVYLTDHISKGLNEPNLIRCHKIPKCPGADWRDLPDEKVRLSCGKEVKLVQGFLEKTGKRHNQWKGLLGRLDWEGNFPTSITDPQPMGKVGRCFHPEHDRILSVREYARAQGFPDSYNFAGKIQHKHRQIGNAVPPPLAFALGRKLKEALEAKHSIDIKH